MTWAKVDDQFHAHRKAKKAWKAHRGSLGLHLFAMSYCAGHLTDGLVDDEFVEEKLPLDRERTAVTDALVAAGLWTREDDGWRINDWLDFNPSREEVVDRRRRDAERKASRRHADSAQDPRRVRADSNGSPGDPSRAGASPDPTRPDLPPLPPTGGRARDRERWIEEAVTYAASAGVTGDKKNVCRAVEQAAKPHAKVRTLDEFRKFAGLYFESLTVEAAA